MGITRAKYLRELFTRPDEWTNETRHEEIENACEWGAGGGLWKLEKEMIAAGEIVKASQTEPADKERLKGWIGCVERGVEALQSQKVGQIELLNALSEGLHRKPRPEIRKFLRTEIRERLGACGRTLVGMKEAYKNLRKVRQSVEKTNRRKT